MEATGLSSTVILTGLLPLVVVVACLLALPVSFFLLRLYRRAVIAGMRAATGAPSPEEPREPPSPPPATALGIVEVASTAPPDSAGMELTTTHLAQGPWRGAAVYAIAGVAYAALMTAGWLFSDLDLNGNAVQVSFLAWLFYWPAVLATVLVAGYDQRRWAQVVGGYAVVLTGIVATAMLRGNSPALLGAWVILDGLPTILVFTFTSRSIRAVGPMVLALLLILAAGSQALVWLASANTAALAAIAASASALGLTAKEVFLALILSGMLVFAALGWPVLRWVGRRYEARKFSDQALLVDAHFLMFGVVQSIWLAHSAPIWVLTGVVAFAGYKTCALIGFRLAPGPVGPPRTLLLLRVFRLGTRSERFFDKLRRHWLAIGSVQMIAGPDLVTATVEPHEFLEFLTGHLGRRFVKSTADVEARMGARDRGTDPDGRYRVAEFFCRTDTWQMVMRRLAATSDAVLMDLRSFAAGNQGCLYELGQLLEGVDLDRVVLLVDDTTDEAFLRDTLRSAWSRVSSSSPNRKRPSPVARLFRLGDASEATLVRLGTHLLGPGPRAAVAWRGESFTPRCYGAS